RSPVPRRQHRRGRGGTSPADAPRRDVLPAPRLPGDPELRAAAGLPARRGGGHRHRGVVPRGRSPRTGRPAPAAPRPTGPRTAAVRDPRTTHLRRPGGRAGSADPRWRVPPPVPPVAALDPVAPAPQPRGDRGRGDVHPRPYRGPVRVPHD